MLFSFFYAEEWDGKGQLLEADIQEKNPVVITLLFVIFVF